MPKVSVLITSYNKPDLLKKALESVLAQTYQDFEIIVSDDASTEDIESVVREFSRRDPRIRFIRQSVNTGGPSIPDNEAISVSRGEYLAFLAHDDEWMPQKLKHQVDFLEKNKDYWVVGTEAIVINKDGKEKRKVSVLEDDVEIRGQILIRNCFVASAVVIRRPADPSHLFRRLHFVEDYDAWLQVGKLGKFYNIQKPLVCYREYEGNITSSLDPEEQLRVQLVLIQEYKNDYPNYYKAVAFYYLKILLYKLHLVNVYEKYKSFVSRNRRYLLKQESNK